MRSEFFSMRKANQEAWEFPSVFQKIKTPIWKWSHTEEGQNFFDSMCEVVYRMTRNYLISIARLCNGEYMVQVEIFKAIVKREVKTQVAEHHEPASESSWLPF